MMGLPPLADTMRRVPSVDYSGPANNAEKVYYKTINYENSKYYFIIAMKSTTTIISNKIWPIYYLGQTFVDFI